MSVHLYQQFLLFHDEGWNVKDDSIDTVSKFKGDYRKG